MNVFAKIIQNHLLALYTKITNNNDNYGIIILVVTWIWSHSEIVTASTFCSVDFYDPNVVSNAIYSIILLYRSSGDRDKYFDISEFRYNHLLY